MKKVYIFSGITFFLTWLLAFNLMLNGGYSNPSALMVISICMFMPAISVIMTILITKSSFKDIWIKASLKKNLKYYLIGWLAPAILIIIGSAIYFIIFPSHFDSSMSTMVESSRNQFIALGQPVPPESQLKSMLIVQLILGLFLAPILNFIPCLGEELGWRGYLLPNLLQKYNPLKATLISSTIWGIWHAPMIAMGHNYGLGYPSAPFGGILAMILFCIVIGSLFSYITLHSKSCIPATIAHGTLNGFAAFGVTFTATTNINPFLGPMPMGIIGGIGFIVVGIICLKAISKMDFSKENGEEDYSIE